MDKNSIYDAIVSLNGDCFKSNVPMCDQCPFKNKCLHSMISLAEYIPKETRLQWALNELIEGLVFEEQEEK
jgi:adenine-specific DNA glycosylase